MQCHWPISQILNSDWGHHPAFNLAQGILWTSLTSDFFPITKQHSLTQTACQLLTGYHRRRTQEATIFLYVLHFIKVVTISLGALEVQFLNIGFIWSTDTTENKNKTSVIFHVTDFSFLTGDFEAWTTD